MIRLQHTVKRCIIRSFEHLQPFCGSHIRALDEIMAYDIIDLSARLTVIVNDDDGFVAMINLPPAEGHSLVNLLQARLDFWIEPEYKGRHIRALVELSQITAQYPDYMSLRGIGIEYGPAAGNGFGEVYRGRLGGQKLAIKVLRVLRRMKDTKSMQGTFLRKAVMWRQLSHPNVLPFLGLYRLERSPPLMCLLTPWVENGNLAEYLNKFPNTNCLHLSLDIAQGLEYLHGMQIVHGNLKGPNILISPSGRACLADTGQAAPKNIKDLLMTDTILGTEGTLKWRAPELLLAKSNDDTRLVTQATDVYAFAMVCYEMFSGELPFRDFSDQKLASALVQGERPPRPFHPLSRLRGLDDDMWDVVEVCWNQDAEKRLEASQVVECLRQFLRFVIDIRPPYSNMAPKSLMWYKQEDHPFCALAPAPEDNDTLKRLKHISKGDNSGLANNNQIYPPSTYIEDGEFCRSLHSYNVILSYIPQPTMTHARPLRRNPLSRSLFPLI
ncbi:hypothetical protein PILCRDRAFT_706883 [Piloderma croceum F 1598]|uniref:Protein kinase domain-containing protein n=1 Tax=Piloderma croceum (strain F 1598) TaxID=765440 RepID=A0A0C3AKA3_PILCF|nr:hypothetical protein PILCRDRAFT_706883 [Piloderma croceum F 1598]